MKKRLAGILLCAALLLSAIPGVGAFSDVKEGETAVAAAALYGMGVVSGTPEGNFLPDDTLTRAQVCVMVTNMMGLSGQVNTYARKTLFADVPSGAWYNGYVNLAYAKGVINGYGNGNFGPDDVISYGQVVTILLRMLGYTTKEIGSVWPGDYTAYAAQLGLSEGLSLKDNDPVTRGQAAILFYRALKTNTNGSNRAYYNTISGLSSSVQAIVLDTDASYGGRSGMLMVYESANGINYYDQARPQSKELEGSLGQLLFDASGKVMGFLPDSASREDLTIASATASILRDTAGRSLRIPSDTTVIADGQRYTYHNGGYLRLEAHKGSTVRVFYDEDGSVLCLYLSGGADVTAEATVATGDDLLGEFEAALGLAGKSYSITKNGAAATADSLSAYDVAYYDASSATLRVSDYRVEGYLTAASPSVVAAQTITVSGATLEVLECAWESLSQFKRGDEIALLLTDDGKVARVYKASKISTEMIGVLDTQGKSVTLIGSGITLSAAEMDYPASAPGALVKVEVGGKDKLRCTRLSSENLKLNPAEGTLGGYPVAGHCAVYESVEGGYVYDLSGNRGSAETGLGALAGQEELKVSYYHRNAAGEVDIIVVDDVTGNLYTYGQITFNTAVGANDDRTASVVNASGAGQKYICTQNVKEDSYVGVALGTGMSGSARIVKVLLLNALTGVEKDAFFRANDSWQVTVDGEIYPIDEQVQIHLPGLDSWMSGEDGLMTALAEGYTLTLYADRSAAEGGQIRLVKAK